MKPEETLLKLQADRRRRLLENSRHQPAESKLRHEASLRILASRNQTTTLFFKRVKNALALLGVGTVIAIVLDIAIVWWPL